MKRILVIGGHSAYASDVAEAEAFARSVAVVHGTAVAVSHVDAIVFHVAPQHFSAYDLRSRAELSSYDLIILRNKMRTYSNIAYALSRYCHAHDVPFFNDYSSYFPGTKLAQAIVFYEQTVPFLPTVYVADHSYLAQAVTERIGYPCIVKSSRGAQGAQNYLVQTAAALDQAVQADSSVDFIAQEYCPNDRDYRILIAGSQQLVIARRGSDDTHLNNTSTGAQAALVPSSQIPASIIQQSRRVAAALSLTIVGVDVMPRLNSDQWYFLETNSQPQIFTGSFTSEKQALFTAFLTEFVGDTDSNSE